MPNLYPAFDPPDFFDLMDEGEKVQYEIKSPSFDYKNNKVNVEPNGTVRNVDDKESYRFWVIKCLLTERFKYLGYGTDFGVEIESIMQSDYPRDIAESEIQRTITEALSIDERTLSVENFTFEWKGEAVWITFEIESIYDSESYELVKGGEGVGRVAVRAA